MFYIFIQEIYSPLKPAFKTLIELFYELHVYDLLGDKRTEMNSLRTLDEQKNSF